MRLAAEATVRTTRLSLTADTALRRRCSRILADQRRRARGDGLAQLPYGLADLLELARATCCASCGRPVAGDF